MRKVLLLAAGLGILSAVFIAVVPQARFLFFGLPEERMDGSTVDIGAVPAGGTVQTVEAALLDAGLSPEPILGDTGISGHLERLGTGAVTEAELKAYASNLRSLALRTAEIGRQIPSSFWDVDTAELQLDGWTSYRIVAALASPEGAPYLDALGLAYTRFHAFKTRDDLNADSAMDTALDLFVPVIELIKTVPPEHMLERSQYIVSDAQAALYLWQQIVVGATRTNPLTRIKLFNHGFTRRFHVGTIWQYENGIPQGNSAIWGVTGFAPRYVGPPENNNQVEHMSISMTVQGILKEPLLVLDAFEEFERIAGSASGDEARADEALNAAVRDTFIARFESDLSGAIEALRARLSAD